MRKEGIQTRKRKPKQNSGGGGGLSSLSQVLGGPGGHGLGGHGGDLTSMMMSNGGIGNQPGAGLGGQHGNMHPSLHNSLMNSGAIGKSHMFGHHHGASGMGQHPHGGHPGMVHGHHGNHAAAAAAAAAVAVAAAVVDSHSVKLEVEWGVHLLIYDSPRGSPTTHLLSLHSAFSFSTSFPTLLQFPVLIILSICIQSLTHLLSLSLLKTVPALLWPANQTDLLANWFYSLASLSFSHTHFSNIQWQSMSATFSSL